MVKPLHIDSFKVSGISGIGPSSFVVDEREAADFSKKIWHEFIDKIISFGISLDQDMFGISWPADDLNPPQQISYFCGFKSEIEIYGLENLEVKGGNYFEYRYEGFAVDVEKGFQTAYLEAFPSSGLKRRAGQHIEIYGEEYDPNSPVSIFRILIPTL